MRKLLASNEIGIKASDVFPPESELIFEMQIVDEVIKVESLVERVTAILFWMASISGIKISVRADEIKRIYTQGLKK